MKIKPPYHYELMMLAAPLYKNYEDKEAFLEVYAELFKVIEILDRRKSRLVSVLRSRAI